MRLIESHHLNSWADSIASRARLPGLVKQLIRAVVERPDTLRFPSGDDVGLPGYDGVLVVNGQAHQFVPHGPSVWEMGTNKDHKTKADKDYKKRRRTFTESQGGEGVSRTAAGLGQSDTVFVFVMPRAWHDKEDWVAARKAEGIWRDVKVIDGVDLVNWIEMAPAVALEFASELKLVPDAGLQFVSQAWEEWCKGTEPPTSEELVVIGREEQEKELVSRAAGSPSIVTVRADSAHEAFGFALAAFRRIPKEDDRNTMVARTIVALNEEVASRLGGYPGINIVLKEVRGQVSGALLGHARLVIIPEGNDVKSSRDVIQLRRPEYRSFAEALARMGLSEEEGERVARACGRSVTIFRRVRHHANYVPPAWAQKPAVDPLLPVLLAGRWNASNQQDRTALCRLADAEDYDRLEEQIQGFLHVDDPPIQRIGPVWTLVAPVDTFALIARFLGSSHLKRFKSVFRDVFSRIDRRVDKPPLEWPIAHSEDEEAYSEWLRAGLAEILLLIAERGSDVNMQVHPSARDYVNDVVRGLPGLRENWKVLASIRDEFARLMEAAPDPLLDSLEHMLKAKPDDLCKLFVEGGFLGGESFHTGILWGLETLAWDPDFLPRVALLLAGLASIDPGGKLSNRPINSLIEILLPWNPSTYASTQDRIAILDLILNREPEVAWPLLEKLLPDATTISHSTAKPRWRDVGEPPAEYRTVGGYMRASVAVFERALDRAGAAPERWQSILETLSALAPELRTRALDLLRWVAESDAPAEVRSALWATLRDFVHRHRTYQDTAWALKGDELRDLEHILDGLAPDDLVECSRWLFDEHLPELRSGERDFHQWEHQANELRTDAATEIVGKLGLNALVRLGIEAKFPGLVAVTAIPLLSSIDEVRKLLEKTLAEGPKALAFSGFVSSKAYELYPNEWYQLVQAIAEENNLTSETVGELLRFWPDNKDTCDRIEKLGLSIATEYWKSKLIHIFNDTPENNAYQIERLIAVGRAREVMDRVAHHGKNVSSSSLISVFDSTFDTLDRAQSEEEARSLLPTDYEVSELLKTLRARPDVSRNDIVRREFRALPLLRFHYDKDLTLHEFMANEPNFFVEVICNAYWPATRDMSDETEQSREQQARAESSYWLLKGMHCVPGAKGGTIDHDHLFDWTENVLTGAKDVDRLDIAKDLIGHILAHAPSDYEDDAWPHRVVRELVDHIASEELDQGLMVERYNLRGVYSKAMYEGGNQERALATQYREWAGVSRAKWPRMARVLEGIARSWEADARREDERAEQDKIRFS